MSYSAYEILEAASVAELNTAIAAAIVAGKQPVGDPSIERMPKRYIQAVAAGTPGAFFESEVITVTTGQLLALRAAPKTLLAAPGAGEAIIPVYAELFYDYNSIVYAVDAADNLEFRYTDNAGALTGTVETNGFITVASDQHRHYIFDVETTPVANAALVLTVASSEVLNGDSPLKVKVYYRVITLMT